MDLISELTNALIKERTADLFSQRGRLYFNAGYHELAIQDFEDGLKLDQKHVGCYILRIYALCRLECYTDALEICDKTLTLDHGFSSAYCGKGLVYYRTNRYEDALKECHKAIELDPKNPYPYNICGLVYEQQGRYDDALKEYNKAIELDSTFAWSYNNRGNVYRDQQGRYDDALKEYNKAIELDPTDSFPYSNRGLVYRSQGRYDDALKECHKAIELDPKNPYSHHRCGLVYRSQGRYDDALKEFDKAIELKRDFVTSYNGRGNVYRDQGRYDDALKEFNKAIELKPDFAPSYNGRGDFAPSYNGRGKVYFDQNKFEDALDNYKKAYELYVEGKDAYYKSVAKRRIKELEYLIGSLKKTKDYAANIIEETKNFTNEIEQNEKLRAGFYSHKQSTKSVDSNLLFTVLRKWNSFTPIIGGGFRSSKGGGYFIQSGKTGLVIDPGFNFVENFMAENHTFKEITAVLITHAHNDHTADLDSLLTILHNYNKELYGGDLSDPHSDIKEGSILEDVLNYFKCNLEKIHSNPKLMKRVKDEAELRFSKVAKKITFYITSGTFKKYAGFFDLMDNRNYTVVCVDKDNYNNFTIGEIRVHVIKAQHYDLISDNTSVGFCFEQDDFVLIYTGDTGFWGVRETYKELSKAYTGKRVVLVANFGGFKRSELNYYSDNEQKNQYYKNHLGRLGLAKLVEILKPEICVISEFGEEFAGYRNKLTEIFAEVYREFLPTKFLPADIGLQVNCVKNIPLQVSAIQSIANTSHYVFVNLPDVRAVEVTPIGQLYYYHYLIDPIELAVKKMDEFHRAMHS